MFTGTIFTVAGYEVTSTVLGELSLDGGAIFGSVPKTLWSKWLPPDADNRIRIVTRSLLIRGHGRSILVDAGMGNKWEQRFIDIFAIQECPEALAAVDRDPPTDVVLTHLHFDHCGGLTRQNDLQTVLSWPAASVYVQSENYKIASAPNPKEKASYLRENVEPLQHGKLNLLNGPAEIFPGIRVHVMSGHTAGLQCVEIRDDSQILLFPSDLIPTSHHLPTHFTMGYDMCASEVMKEREEILRYAEETGAVVVFEHDPDVPAATIGRNKRWHFCVKETIEF